MVFDSRKECCLAHVPARDQRIGRWPQRHSDKAGMIETLAEVTTSVIIALDWAISQLVPFSRYHISCGFTFLPSSHPASLYAWLNLVDAIVNTYCVLFYACHCVILVCLCVCFFFICVDWKICWLSNRLCHRGNGDRPRRQQAVQGQQHSVTLCLSNSVWEKAALFGKTLCSCFWHTWKNTTICKSCVS